MFKDPFIEDFDKSRANKISDLLKEITGLRLRPEPYSKGDKEIIFSCTKVIPDEDYCADNHELLKHFYRKAKLDIFEESPYKINYGNVNDFSSYAEAEIEIIVKNDHETVINLEKIIKGSKNEKSINDAADSFIQDIESRTKGMDPVAGKAFLKEVLRRSLWAFHCDLYVHDRELEETKTHTDRVSAAKSQSKGGKQRAT